jgi:hypothetical protein
MYSIGQHVCEARREKNPKHFWISNPFRYGLWLDYTDDIRDIDLLAKENLLKNKDSFFFKYYSPLTLIPKKDKIGLRHTTISSVISYPFDFTDRDYGKYAPDAADMLSPHTLIKEAVLDKRGGIKEYPVFDLETDEDGKVLPLYRRWDHYYTHMDGDYDKESVIRNNPSEILDLLIRKPLLDGYHFSYPYLNYDRYDIYKDLVGYQFIYHLRHVPTDQVYIGCHFNIGYLLNCLIDKRFLPGPGYEKMNVYLDRYPIGDWEFRIIEDYMNLYYNRQEDRLFLNDRTLLYKDRYRPNLCDHVSSTGQSLLEHRRELNQFLIANPYVTLKTVVLPDNKFHSDQYSIMLINKDSPYTIIPKIVPYP